MDKEQEQGFFNQIEEVLHAHEDTYEPGAWEEFDANRKKGKRKMPLYLWTAVAAAILIVISFVLFETNSINQIQKAPALAKSEIQKVLPKLDTFSVTKDIATLASPKVMVSMKRPLMNLMLKDTVVAPLNYAQTATVEMSNPQVKTATNVVQPLIIENTTVPTAIKPIREYAGAYDSLVHRNGTSSVLEKNASKFTYSLAVSPSVSNQKINFGAGMELSYAVNDRLSINSGLIYTALNAKSDGKSLPTTSAVKNQQANLSLTGIELPLGIQYQTNSGYYASAGVSALGLINDKLEYNYLQDNTVTFTEVRAGIATQVLKVVSERRIEESTAPLDNYMGFFNFSAGKKQAFGKTNLNIGPFVKIPFSSVSSERIKLLQGGVKLSIDF